MKKYIFSLVCLIISILCLVSYNVIGAEVLLDGTLKEPFFLIPTAYLFLLIFIVSIVVIKINHVYKSKKNNLKEKK